VGCCRINQAQSRCPPHVVLVAVVEVPAAHAACGRADMRQPMPGRGPQGRGGHLGTHHSAASLKLDAAACYHRAARAHLRSLAAGMPGNSKRCAFPCHVRASAAPALVKYILTKQSPLILNR
jgi:hypothetical protein